MKEILDAILDQSSQPGDFAAPPVPELIRAVTLHRDEEHMFDGLDTSDRDPRKSLHQEVPVPELGLGEALVAVMASSVNYNTGVELHLLADVHVRLLAPLRQAVPAHRAA